MCYIHRYIHVEEIISAKYVCMIDVMYSVHVYTMYMYFFVLPE